MLRFRSVISSMFVFLLIFTVFPFSTGGADQFCSQGTFRLTAKGVHLTSTNILSSHNVESSMDCGQRCLQEITCVGFNYRATRKSNEPNCQVTNTTEGVEQSDVNNDVVDWTFYEVLDVPSQQCSKNPCKNGGQCVPNACQNNGFSCECGLKHKGKLCEIKKVFKSCQEVLSISSDAQDGIYKIETRTGFTNVYCQMTSLTGCSGGGWTMVMKINGTKSTFVYSSPYWSNKQSYNLAGGLTSFDDRETKLPTYWSTSFKELCIGLKVGADVHFLSISSYPANSLYDLISDGQYRRTNLRREKWQSLIAGSSLQANCNRQGLNVRSDRELYSHVRIGFLANQENDCVTGDSFVGLGGQVYGHPGCLLSYPPPNSAGNLADCSPLDGTRNTRAMGYLLVR